MMSVHAPGAWSILPSHFDFLCSVPDEFESDCALAERWPTVCPLTIYLCSMQDDVEGVCAGAEKELVIEQMLHAIEQRWAKRELDYAEDKSTLAPTLVKDVAAEVLRDLQEEQVIVLPFSPRTYQAHTCPLPGVCSENSRLGQFLGSCLRDFLRNFSCRKIAILGRWDYRS